MGKGPSGETIAILFIFLRSNRERMDIRECKTRRKKGPIRFYEFFDLPNNHYQSRLRRLLFYSIHVKPPPQQQCQQQYRSPTITKGVAWISNNKLITTTRTDSTFYLCARACMRVHTRGNLSPKNSFHGY